MLRNNNVCLRAVKTNDADLLYQAINSPELVCFNAPYKPVHEVNHLQWFSSLLNDASKQFFMIDYIDQPVGSIQLVDIDPIHRNAELKIRIFDDEHRGKNIGTESVKILCDHAFTNLNLIRVWLRVFATNERAIASYTKAGFTSEGVMKKAAYINGNFIDIVCMARIND